MLINFYYKVMKLGEIPTLSYVLISFKESR